MDHPFQPPKTSCRAFARQPGPTPGHGLGSDDGRRPFGRLLTVVLRLRADGAWKTILAWILRQRNSWVSRLGRGLGIGCPLATPGAHRDPSDGFAPANFFASRVALFGLLDRPVRRPSPTQFCFSHSASELSLEGPSRLRRFHRRIDMRAMTLTPSSTGFPGPSEARQRLREGSGALGLSEEPRALTAFAGASPRRPEKGRRRGALGD